MQNYTELNYKIQQIYKYGRDNDYPILLDDSKELLINTLLNSKAVKVLEIGTCIGYSASCMLCAKQDVQIVTIEKNKDVAQIAKTNFEDLKLQDRVCLIVDDAINVITKINEKFDFIFLDGPKAQYRVYLPYLIDVLNVGGVVFADNVYFKGFVLKDENEFIPRGIRSIVKNLRLFLKMVKADERLTSEVVDVGDGVCIIKKIKE